MYVNLANFIKTKRKEANLTQQEFAERAGVALTVVRKIEQGKENLSLSKVNQVLLMFGSKLVPANLKEIENETGKSFLSKSFCRSRYGNQRWRLHL